MPFILKEPPEPFGRSLGSPEAGAAFPGAALFASAGGTAVKAGAPKACIRVYYGSSSYQYYGLKIFICL